MLLRNCTAVITLALLPVASVLAQERTTPPVATLQRTSPQQLTAQPPTNTFIEAAPTLLARPNTVGGLAAPGATAPPSGPGDRRTPPAPPPSYDHVAASFAFDCRDSSEMNGFVYQAYHYIFPGGTGFPSIDFPNDDTFQDMFDSPHEHHGNGYFTGPANIFINNTRAGAIAVCLEASSDDADIHVQSRPNGSQTWTTIYTFTGEPGVHLWAFEAPAKLNMRMIVRNYMPEYQWYAIHSTAD